MSNRNYSIFILIILMMGSIGLFAADIYLPALPSMSIYFNCSQGDIQASFTVFLLGLASCQLFAGMFADRFGRKKIALIGFSIFTVASFMCVYSETLLQFISFRYMQAIGGGVGSVLFRALIADRYNREEAVKIFSTVFPIIGLSPALAPLIGGYLTDFWGWQSTFFFMTGFGVLMLVLVIFCLDNKKQKEEQALEITKSLGKVRGYFGVIRNIEFLGYAFIICCGFCVFRSYAVESPFVFSNQGFMPEEIGQLYLVLSLAYFSGNLMAKKAVSTTSIEKALRIGFLLFVLGGGLLVTSVLIFEGNPYAIILPMTLVTVGNGFLFPIGSAAAMTAVPTEFSGTASGLVGAIQCIFAAFCINWMGEVCHGDAKRMSFFLGCIILLGLLSYLFLILYRPKARVSTT